MKSDAFNVYAAVLAGVFVSSVLVFAVELFGAVVHPVPEGFGGTMEEMSQHVEAYPQWVLAVVVPAWAVAGFLGTWVAQRIGNAYCSAIVGLLLLVALVFNISKLPYPMWFKIANLLVIPSAAIVGARLAMRRKTAGLGMSN